MSRKHLAPELKAVLDRATRRTTLSIILGDGTPLNYSTAPTEVGGTVYLARLAKSEEALNLESSLAKKLVNLKLSNHTLVLGQQLMNVPNVLNKMRAMVGCYFYDDVTGGEWHDNKMPGIITVGRIGKPWIEIEVEGRASALKYPGITVEMAFPDHEITLPAPPQQPVYNDLVTAAPSQEYYGGFAGGYNNYAGRNYMPELSFDSFQSYQDYRVY